MSRLVISVIEVRVIEKELCAGKVAGVPAHVHAEAILSAFLEARPAGLTIVQLMAATERTCARSPPRRGSRR
ncbi:hypothetical protein [Streptomyces sp. NPDC017958]|uniref:hypothetical protein n=1 Tax=Streptomyces sp. NPDC017958 TaxID=3365021 RepID=UPI0037911065